MKFNLPPIELKDARYCEGCLFLCQRFTSSGCALMNFLEYDDDHVSKQFDARGCKHLRDAEKCPLIPVKEDKQGPTHIMENTLHG